MSRCVLRTRHWRALGVAAALSVAAAGATGVSATAASAAERGAHHSGGSSAHSSLPAVAHGTDLSMEPVVHAGTGRPPTKLLTKNLVAGTGAEVTLSSTVDVKYVGADYTNGKDFTSSTWKSGEAASFSLHTVVPGFAEGLVGMKVGGRREIVIPPALGYGDQAAGPIKANETLVFVVDLVSVSSS